MSTETVKKLSNRAIQRTHATYKKNSEISEALNLIRPYVNESTYKFLSHFLHTGGSGVTQAKNKVICEKVGIHERTYYKKVKPEIENTFSQSLIITTEAPMKMDKKRKKKVKASPFKSLMPLSVLKHLLKQKEQEEQAELNGYWEECETVIQEPVTEDRAVNRAVNRAVEFFEENAQIPCESKDEGESTLQQNNSFRENHLEKDLNSINNNTSPAKKVGGGQKSPQIDLSKIDSKTFELMNSYKGFSDYPFYINNEQKNEDLKTRIIYWVQMAINKAEADINKPEHQHVIKEAVGTVICHYDLCDYSENELTKLVYTSVKEILENVISGQRETAVTSERPRKKSSRPKYTKKPNRTEILPEWFEEESKRTQEQDKEQTEETAKVSDEEKRARVNEKFKALGINIVLKSQETPIQSV